MSTAALWEMLARPLEPARAAEALLGISYNAAQVMTNALFVTSPEADDLLEEMPRAVRSLTISSAQAMELCHGEVRGPIQWAETMSLRGGMAGDESFFVCSSPRRAYDTPQNRVLVAALLSVAQAASMVDAGTLRDRDTPFARHIRHNGATARRYLEHRALAGVPRGRVSGRDRNRTRSATRSKTYGPALAVLERAAEPMTADEVALVSDSDTARMHAVAVMTVAELRLRGLAQSPLRVRDRVVSSDPFLFAHPRARLPMGSATGVLVGGRPVSATEPEEVPAALDAMGLPQLRADVSADQ